MNCSSVNQIEKNFYIITIYYLCRRNVFQRSGFLCKQLSSGCVYICRGTVSVVKHHHKTFNNFKCSGANCHGFERVTRDIPEMLRDTHFNLPTHFSFLGLDTKILCRILKMR